MGVWVLFSISGFKSIKRADSIKHLRLLLFIIADATATAAVVVVVAVGDIQNLLQILYLCFTFAFFPLVVLTCTTEFIMSKVYNNIRVLNIYTPSNTNRFTVKTQLTNGISIRPFVIQYFKAYTLFCCICSVICLDERNTHTKIRKVKKKKRNRTWTPNFNYSRIISNSFGANEHLIFHCASAWARTNKTASFLAVRRPRSNSLEIAINLNLLNERSKWGIWWIYFFSSPCNSILFINLSPMYSNQCCHAKGQVITLPF